LWHLDRLVVLEGATARLHARRADAHLGLKEWRQASDAYDQAIRLGLEDWQYFHRRGTAHAELGEWKEASADLGAATRSADAPAQVWSDHALLCLKMKEEGRYREACKQLLERFGKGTDALPATVLPACLLRPEAVNDPEGLVQVAGGSGNYQSAA